LWLVIFSLAVSEMLIPYYMGQLVGTVAEYAGAPEDGRGIVYQNFALYILFFITFWVMRHASGFVLAYVQSSLMKDLTAVGFSKVQSFSTNWHNNSFSGATVREITRGMKAFEQLSDTLYFSIFPTFFVLVFMIGFMTYLYPMIGIVAACFALFFIALSVFISLRVVAPRNRASNEQDSKLGGAIADAVTCNQLVRAYGMETEEEKRLGGVLELWRSKTVGAGMLRIGTASCKQLFLFLRGLFLLAWGCSYGCAVMQGQEILHISSACLQGCRRGCVISGCSFVTCKHPPTK
jgi:ATP-binding cassette subfamily B protein